MSENDAIKTHFMAQNISTVLREQLLVLACTRLEGVVVAKKCTPHSRAVGDLYITDNYRRGLDLGIYNKIWSSRGYSSICGAFSHFILGGT